MYRVAGRRGPATFNKEANVYIKNEKVEHTTSAQPAARKHSRKTLKSTFLFKSHGNKKCNDASGYAGCEKSSWLEVVSKSPLGFNLCVGLKHPILKIFPIFPAVCHGYKRG